MKLLSMKLLTFLWCIEIRLSKLTWNKTKYWPIIAIKVLYKKGSIKKQQEGKEYE